MVIYKNYSQFHEDRDLEKKRVFLAKILQSLVIKRVVGGQAGRPDQTAASICLVRPPGLTPKL